MKIYLLVLSTLNTTKPLAGGIGSTSPGVKKASKAQHFHLAERNPFSATACNRTRPKTTKTVTESEPLIYHRQPHYSSGGQLSAGTSDFEYNLVLISY